jgi:hypothetical protein
MLLTAPVANADSYDMIHDTELWVDYSSGVLFNDSNTNPDSLLAAISDDPTHGTVVLNEDGSFDYTPDEGWTGTDSFTYTDTSMGETSDLATVTIHVTDTAPVANDDTEMVDDPGDGSPVILDVLANDDDPDNGETIHITSVGATANGGTVQISSDGLAILYTSPRQPSPTVLSTSDETLSSDDDMTEDTATCATTPDDGGIKDFTDTFTYTISDDFGEIAAGNVKVVKGNPVAEWTLDSMQNTDKAAVGVDGVFGYDATVTENLSRANGQGGWKTPDGCQYWLFETQTLSTYYVNATTGNVDHPADLNRTTVTSENGFGDKEAPIERDEDFKLTAPAAASNVLFTIEHRTVTVGISGSQWKLPPSNGQPYVPNEYERGNMTHIRFGYTYNIDYVWVNKPLIDSLHSQNSLSDEALDDITHQLCDVGTNGMDYDQLPAKKTELLAINEANGGWLDQQ